MRDLEIKFSDADDARVQAYHQVDSTDAMLEKFNQTRLESNGMQLEMAITLVLHKILKSEFSIAIVRLGRL